MTSGSYPQGQSVQFIAQNIQNHVQRKTSKAINPSALEVLLFLPLMGQWTISGHLNLDVPDPSCEGYPYPHPPYPIFVQGLSSGSTCHL